MIGDAALPHILNKQSHYVRKQWLKQRGKKVEVLTVSEKNFNISKLIDRLNENIRGDYGKETYVCDLQEKKKRIKDDKCFFDFMGL